MSFLFRILYIFTTFIQTLIVFRIILTIINANTAHSFVGWIFTTSDIFITPFSGILTKQICLDKFCFEVTPLVALLFFSVIGFVLSELSKAFRQTD